MALQSSHALCQGHLPQLRGNNATFTPSVPVTDVSFLQAAQEEIKNPAASGVLIAADDHLTDPPCYYHDVQSLPAYKMEISFSTGSTGKPTLNGPRGGAFGL